VFAQATTGTIRGVVSDPSKAVVPNATVTVTNKATSAERKVATNAAGEYLVPNLPPGDYEIKTTVGGFKTGQSEVVLQVGENVEIDFELQVGQQTETVVVTAETPAINTSDYKVDGVVNRKQIDNLPLNGRNFLQLAMLEPGVDVQAVDNPGTSPNNFFRVSIAGAAQNLTRISVDGATINDRVTGGTAQNFSQETVQEFQISVANFDIATSTTGVGSINVVSRSGTNNFHGSGFLFYRDHNMAAFPGLTRDPRRFTNPALDKPFFARRAMGGSLGGPIKKDKLFFFFNYEYQNQDGIQAIANRHPIFSQFDSTPSNPLNFKQSNIKFDYRVNEKHSAFFRFSTDNNDNYNSTGANNLPSNWVVTKNVSTQGLLGVTSVFTPNVSNDLRYSYGFYSGRLKIPTTKECPDPIICIGIGGPRFSTTNSNFVIGNNLNTPQNRVLRTYQLTDTLSWTKGSHRVRFGGEWEHFYGRGSWAYLEPAFVTLWDPVHIFQFMAATGGAASPFAPLYNALPTSLKLNATGTGPLQPGLFPTYADIQRLPLAGFATGVGDAGQPQSFNQPSASRNDRVRLFIGDQWRIKPNFTFTYGVAYSVENKLMNHDLNRPSYLAPIFAGDLRAPQIDKNNWDPSIGFAWDVKNNGRTVIRGGGGIYHDSNNFWTRLVERAYTGPAGNGRYIIPGSLLPNPFGTGPFQFGSAPTSVTGAMLMSVLPAVRAGLQTRLGNGTDLSVRGIEVLKTTGDAGFGGLYDPNTVVPYTAQTTLGIQREIRPNLAVTADFVMRRAVKFGGLHSVFIYDRNRFNRPLLNAAGDPVLVNGQTVPNPIIPVCTGATPALNPNDPKAQCSGGIISASHSGANYRYTGLHVKVDKRFSNRYLFVASYALSKYTGFNGVINYNNFYEADDYQGADRTHRFTFSGFLELPTFNGSNRFARALFNTWQLGLISQTVSKPPLATVVTSADIDGDGFSTVILPGTKYRSFGRSLSENMLRNLVAQFNTNFSTAATGKRSKRNEVIPTITLPAKFDNGDYFLSQDVRLSRVFRLTEQWRLEFIAEGFNVFNFSNLVGYGGTLNGTDFGQPTGRAGGVFGSGGPRAFQFAAKITF
jgi:hypothetical protein